MRVLPTLAFLLATSLTIALAQVNIEPRPAPPAPVQPPLPKANLRVGSNLVLVPVTVVDYRNHPVTGLEKENFRIFDDGVERPIAVFAAEDEPVAVGLVYDHSGSVGPVLRNESGATHTFLATSNPQDEYFLVVFASKPEVALPMTRSSQEVQNRIFTTSSTGATALFDAVILGLNELKKSNLKRKALLVISDGGENNSRYSRGELQKLVEESDALIYAIGYNTTQSDFPVLRWMSELSGGRAFMAQTNEIADISAKIGLELRNRYVIGFSATGVPRDGKYHSLRVQLIPPHGMPPLKTSWRRAYRSPGDDDIK